ncbi:MAG: helix-turn-helix domain-containing protein [Opitutaceae bacterium]|jgi:cytoskeleton protein RodZ|nr:helix-turn-helix domain-containing protein [Opitutaceae bacterium]
MQNIGERLEEARKSKGISIREAAEATKVRGDYLHKFESNQFDLNLPDIYVRGFLRNYATYLGLSAEKIIADYRSLGHGNPQPKISDRETYGRLDLTLGKAKETALDPTDEGKETEDGVKSNPATFKPLAEGLPYIDKAIVVKGLLVLAIVAALVSLIIFIVGLFGNSDETTEPVGSTTDSAVTSTVPQVVVHALDNVRIKMVDEASGAELFQGDLTRGDNRSFPKSSSMLLTADPIQNVEIEMNDQRYPTGLTGRDRIRIQ